MKTSKVCALLLLGFFIATTGYSQNENEISAKMNKAIMKKGETMKTYLIEREIPNAGLWNYRVFHKNHIQ